MTIESESIDALKASNWTQADAEKKVAEIVAAVNQRFAQSTTEMKEKTIRNAIRTLTKSKVEKLMAICIGFTRLQDSNNYDRMKALEVYAQDPARAAQEHYVVLEDPATGKVTLDTAVGRVKFREDPKTKAALLDTKGNKIPVAADHREYLDPDTKKYKNSNWGKELKETIQRTAWFIVMDDKGKGHFMRAFGKFDPKIGWEHAVFGVVSEKGYITVPANGPGVTPVRMLDDASYWKAVDAVAQYDDLAVQLSAILDMDKNKPFVAKGTITHVSESGSMIAIDDDGVAESIAMFADDDAVKAEVQGLSAGNEVLVIATTTDMEDKRNPGQKKRNARLLGFACNPESDAIAANVDGLKDVIYS